MSIVRHGNRQQKPGVSDMWLRIFRAQSMGKMAGAAAHTSLFAHVFCMVKCHSLKKRKALTENYYSVNDKVTH